MRRWPGVYESADSLSRWYRSSMDSSVTLDPKIAAFLITLSSAGIPWGIVTNGGSASQRAKMESAGLEQITPCILILVCDNHFTKVDLGAADRFLLGHGRPSESEGRRTHPE